MSSSMFSAYSEALSRGLLGDVRLGVDFQKNPWDTNCFMAVFYLEFLDKTGKTYEPDWLYFAAFVAHPAHASHYSRALAHGKRNATSKCDQDLFAAINFVDNPEVNCVYVDTAMLAVAATFHPEIKNLPSSKLVARERELLPKAVVPLRDMVMQEISEGHDFWRVLWRPRVLDIAVPGKSWFF